MMWSYLQCLSFSNKNGTTKNIFWGVKPCSVDFINVFPHIKCHGFIDFVKAPHFTTHYWSVCKTWMIFASLLLPKYLVSLFFYCLCPPARSWDGRVPGLVCKIHEPDIGQKLRLYNPLCWSVRRSVRPSHFTFFLVFAVIGLTAPGQMMQWPQIWPLPTRTRLG